LEFAISKLRLSSLILSKGCDPPNTCPLDPMTKDFFGTFTGAHWCTPHLLHISWSISYFGDLGLRTLVFSILKLETLLLIFPELVICCQVSFYRSTTHDSLGLQLRMFQDFNLCLFLIFRLVDTYPPEFQWSRYTPDLRPSALWKFQVSNLTPCAPVISDGSCLINRMAEIPLRHSETLDFRNIKFPIALPLEITTNNGCDSS